MGDDHRCRELDERRRVLELAGSARWLELEEDPSQLAAVLLQRRRVRSKTEALEAQHALQGAIANPENRYTLSTAYLLSGMSKWTLCDHGGAEDDFSLAIEAADTIGQVANARNTLAGFYWSYYRLHSARDLFALSSASAPGTRSGVMADIGAARCDVELGRAELAEHRLAGAASLLEPGRNPELDAHLLHAQGMVRASFRDLGASLRSFDKSQEMFIELGLPEYIVRVHEARVLALSRMSDRESTMAAYRGFKEDSFSFGYEDRVRLVEVHLWAHGFLALNKIRHVLGFSDPSLKVIACAAFANGSLDELEKRELRGVADGEAHRLSIRGYEVLLSRFE